MKNTFIASTVAAIMLSGAASAATLTGTFSIDIYQTLNATTQQSRANEADGLSASTFLDSITYNGALDFGTYDSSDSTTIGDWLASGGGTIWSLEDSTRDLQQSKPDIGSGSATTTFYDITGVFDLGAGFDSVIRHDDGFSTYDDGAFLAAYSNPTGVRNTDSDGFDGGVWRMIYSATNGDPSVLKVTGDNLPSPVPVPAAGFLLVGALGGLGFAGRRRRKAS